MRSFGQEASPSSSVNSAQYANFQSLECFKTLANRISKGSAQDWRGWWREEAPTLIGASKAFEAPLRSGERSSFL